MAQRRESTDGKRSRISIRSDYEPILPPITAGIVRTMVGSGPDGQAMEHCHFAKTMAEMRRRAPSFGFLMRICEKGSSEAWRALGAHNRVMVPVTILKSQRLSDTEFRIFGHFELGDLTPNCDLRVWLSRYSTQSRRSVVHVPRPLYLEIARLWVADRLETD